MKDLTHAYACVVIFWWFVDVSLSWNLKDKMDGDCLVFSDKLFHAIIVDGKKEL